MDYILLFNENHLLNGSLCLALAVYGTCHVEFLFLYPRVPSTHGRSVCLLIFRKACAGEHRAMGSFWVIIFHSFSL